jgi:hypothetical protein
LRKDLAEHSDVLGLKSPPLYYSVWSCQQK